jgi:NAD(P)-dependent dehydrogenase (short-subunit alcohol dehydrogenase family)
MVARGRERLFAAARAIELEGGEVVPLAFDVADKRAIHEIAGLAAGKAGEVDVLIHDASTLGPVPMPPLLDLACEDLSAVLETNLVGPFRLTKAIAGSMVLRRTGTILFVSSDAATQAYPGWGAYGVSKAAADHLARSLAAELGEHGVRTFAVDPGEMDTDMHAAALPDADRSTLARPVDVARTLVEMLETPSRAPNGARLEASTWGASLPPRRGGARARATSGSWCSILRPVRSPRRASGRCPSCSSRETCAS